MSNVRWVAFLLAFVPLMATAAETLPGPVTAVVLATTDGDTIKVAAAVWPGITVRVSVRVAGVDTPELRGRCAGEKALAREARDFTRAAVGDRVILRNIRRGKYAGRMIAEVRVDGGADLAAMLIAAGLGRPYDGGRRRPWCP